MKLKLLFLITFLAMAGGGTFAQNAAPIVGGNISASSSNCATSFSCVWESVLPANAGTTTINIAGTFSATLLVEESNNGGQSWSTAATLSSVGTTTYSTNGFTDIRVRCSAFTSGSAAVTISTGLLQVQSVVTVQGSSSGGGPNLPIPQAQVGPGFNVKNYGAKGDWQSSNNGATTTSTTQTCSDCNFTQADVGKTICGATLATTELPCTTISTVTNATTIITAGAATNTFSPQTFAWGTNNDAAITSAVAGAIAASKAKIIVGNLGVISATPAVYFPAGGYGICNAGLSFGASSLDGITVHGDGPEQSIIYALTGCNYNTGTGVIAFTGSVNYGFLYGLTLDGMNGNNATVGSSSVYLAASRTKISNVIIQRGSGVGLILQGSFYGDNVSVVGNVGQGIWCNGCNGEIHNSISSNNGTTGSAFNLKISNVVGLNGGNGFRWWGGLIDECGTSVNGCTQVVNSNDIWFIGMAGFGTPNSSCLNVDGQSFVHWNGGICGPFGLDTNTGGPVIQAGGVLQASDLRMVGTGTAKCLTNSGAFQDNGGNSCENQFPIASGTSTTTTAVLTLTNVGAAINTNCSVGDSLMVQGAGIAGYDGYYPFGITATSATTLTYTTAGSNLGALGAGGTAYCRNLQTFSGNLPKALLNNPIPNTCYVTITPIVNATTYLLCNFRTQSATNITRIMASSQTTTTCATAPIITISDGTASQTLTLTSAKSSWDSAVDTSTGVGTTIFKPNGTITVKYDAAAASACATPPTQLAISYNVSPILSN